MSKRLIRVLSLILTLVMFMSVSTQAFALGGGGLGDGWDRPIGEDEIRDFDGPVEEEEEPTDYFQTLNEESGVQVTVEAPMGALPTLAELRVEPVEIEDVRDTVNALYDDEVEILLAMDISFWLYGQEIEPEEPVRVKITAEELEGRDDLALIHLPDEDEPEALELIDEEDLSFALGTNEIAFETDGFSTFIVTGSSRKATIHYGYIENNAFVPFASKNISSTSTSFPTGNPTGEISAQSIYNGHDYTYLIYDFPDFKYKETRLSSETGTKIWPALYANRSGGGLFSSYTYRFRYNSYNNTYWNNTTELGNDADIFVIYEPLTVTEGSSSSGSSSGGGSSDVPTLPASKNVVPNGDGTYNITLSVTGVEETQVDIKRANVIVIFDLSGSMNDNMAGNGDYSGTVATINENARLSIAGKAVNALAETLLSKKDSQGNNLVQMALITFSNTATVHKFSGQNYTTSLSAYQDEVNGLSANGATNWEAALNEANALEVSSDTPTYVVFVSDGDPTLRMSRLNDTDSEVYTTAQSNGSWYQYRDGVFGVGSTFRQGHYDAAKRTAQSIVSHNKKFYTIGVSTASQRMSTLATDAYATSGGIPAGETHYFPGNSQQDLKDAFDKIASYVEEGLGFTNVVINDGVTEMTTVETDALTGKPSNFVYRKGTNTNPEQNDVWSGAPEATITEDNHVIWNTSSIGKLENGVTYSVTFTVWPSQESYDIIADINNGIIRNSDGSIARTGTPAEAYAAQPEDVKAQIVIVDGVYTLKTNTGISLTYKYNGTDGEQSVTTIKEGSMPLESTYFGVFKDWQNNMDTRYAQVLTEEVDGKEYLVNSNGDFILDGEEKIELDWDKYDSWKNKAVFYVDLIVTEGDEDYTEIRLTSEDLSTATPAGNPAWTWDKMFIAPGVITHSKTASSGAITVRETGRDYSVREKPSESYYWELSAETYHPMVINGEACVLQLVTENPPTMDDNTFNVNYYKFGGNVYIKLGSADSARITAINERRSNLNLTKKVEAGEGIQIPEDALFTYSVKITYPEGINDDVWFSIMDKDGQFVVNDDDHTYVEGAEQEAGASYYHMASGAEITLKIQAGWNVRFTNMPNDTQYEINETAQPDGFVFKSVEAKADNGGADGTVAETKVTGTIDKPNNVYTATFTNEFLGYFYVYHSGDLSVERFPMAKDGVKVESFNIYAETLEGTLYGGYYSDYVGKSEGFDAAALTYTDGISSDDAEKAHAYDLAYIKESGKAAWSADAQLKTIGTAMKPELNQVYYLKEVPVAYLQPYTYYTYYKENNKIANMWAISDLDDLNYSDAGFYIIDEQKNATSVVSSLSIKAEHSTTTVKLTAFKLFNTKHGVKDGFLSYWKFDDGLVGSKVTVKQYWVTPDGIEVLGTMMRSMDTTGDHCYKGQIVSSDTAINP